MNNNLEDIYMKALEVSKHQWLKEGTRDRYITLRQLEDILMTFKK